MKNRYLILRHGFSLANAAEKIVSTFPNGRLPEYALAERGRQEARAAGAQLRREVDPKNTFVLASDFSRTIETANLVTAEAGLPPVYLCPDLRERDFGTLELASNQRYDDVWDEDRRDVTTFNVERPDSVRRRGLRAIEFAERFFSDADVVVVSHGDCLQILQTFFLDLHPNDHRDVPHLQTGELRRLVENPPTPPS